MEIKVKVPNWAHYKAMCSDGQWYLYATKPVYDGMGGWDNPLRGQMMDFLREPWEGPEEEDEAWEKTSLEKSANSLEVLYNAR